MKDTPENRELLKTHNRQLLLAVNDATIDHMIRLLNVSRNSNILNVLKQLKAEQKRLFYPDNS